MNICAKGIFFCNKRYLENPNTNKKSRKWLLKNFTSKQNLKTNMMKKFMISLLLISSSMFVAAEDSNFGPKKGQYAVSIDATPLLNYAGNLLSGYTGQNHVDDLYFIKDFGVYGKKYISDTNAYRLGVNLDLSSLKTNQPGTPGTGALESTTVNNTDIGLSAGIEYRKGKGRLQGFYGPMVGIGIGSYSTKYAYNGTPNTEAHLESIDGSTINFGLGGFAGVEYFISKQIAVGTEFNIMLKYSSTGRSTDKYQGSPDVKGGSSSEISFGFGQSAFAPCGRLYVSLYF